MNARGTLLIIVLSCSATLQADGYFKWTDQQGLVHYGDRPPASAPSEEIAPAPSTSAAEQERAVDRSLSEQQRAQDLVNQRLRQQAEQRSGQAERIAVTRALRSCSS
jgi:hypothetical protein